MISILRVVRKPCYGYWVNYMDDEALASRLFDLWDACEKEYQRRYEKAINVDVVKAIFERADHHIISMEIQKQRQEVRVQQEKEDDEPATQKQLVYIAKLGGDIKRRWRKKEASEWIDQHKNW